MPCVYFAMKLSTRLVAAFFAAFLLASAGAAGAFAQFDPFGESSEVRTGGDVVDMSLRVSHGRVAPGSSFTAAVRFTIEDDWHLYWRNPGDSGMPPSIDWKLPEGWAAGEVHWPLPKRFVQPGGIIGYGYGKNLALLVEIEVPASAKAGDWAAVEASVEYLVCDDERCVPGEGVVKREVQVAEEAAGAARDESATAMIEAWRGRLPGEARELGLSASVDEERTGEGTTVVRLRWKGGGVKDVEAFPYAVEAVEIKEVEVDGEGRGRTLGIDWRRFAGVEGGASEMPVLVIWREADGPRRGAVVVAPLSGQ